MTHVQERVKADGSTSYRVMFRVNGKQTSETFDDELVAAEFAALVDAVGGEAAKRVRDARDQADHKVPTLAEWFEHYLDHSPGITDGTRAEYRRLAKRSWLPTLGPLPVDVIDKDAITKWIDRQKRTVTRLGKPTSVKSLRNQHALLSTVLASAVPRWRDDNPAKAGRRGIKLPEGERQEMTFLTHDEFARIVTHVEAHWRPLLITLAGTGMRWGEATALQWQDVDLDSSRPHIRIVRAWKHGPTQRVMGIPKTQRSRRTITLPPEVVDVLRPLRGDANPTDLVFRGPRSGQVHHQSFRRVWRAAVTKAKLGKRPRVHDLRHSHVAWLVDAGRPLLYIQRRLGHESIQTTGDTYGHLVDENDAAGLAALSEALTQAMPQLVEEPEELADAFLQIDARRQDDG